MEGQLIERDQHNSVRIESIRVSLRVGIQSFCTFCLLELLPRLRIAGFTVCIMAHSCYNLRSVEEDQSFR
jgi:hypothetical protein